MSLSYLYHVRNKSRCIQKELSSHALTHSHSHSPSDATLETKVISSPETHHDDHAIRIPYGNISYSTTTIHRTESLDLITPPMSCIIDEKSEFYDQRLAVLKQYITNNDNRNMVKLLVYISLEYVINSNPDPILLKNIYDALETKHTDIISGHSLYKYLKQNKNELAEYVHLNPMDQDPQIQHCCEWKLNQIFSLYQAHNASQHQLQSTKLQLQQLQHQHKNLKKELHSKEKELLEIKQASSNITIPITRTASQQSIYREWTVADSVRSHPISIAPRVKREHLSKTKSHNDIDQLLSFEKERVCLIRKKKRNKRLRLQNRSSVSTKNKNVSQHVMNTQQALFIWKQYTERLMYIKQRYPTEYIDRYKAWQKWSNLLDIIEKTGRINPLSINNIWRCIDFARMSLGRYANWILYPKEMKHTKDRKWTKKYLVLMDFNLFLFDKKAEIQCLKQVLSFKHMVLSIASIRNVTSSQSVNNSIGFILKINKNKSIEIRCEDRETKESCVDEFVYQMKCVRDLLKLPHIKLKSADPNGNIWVPFPVGFDR